ncbi:MAG: GMC family oxidoreductase [Sandaracinaceae bacterium]|nr:GMC family oxidoreductase [Sandaracinaceae bacterium]
MTYWVNDEDVARMVRAQAILARIFLAAGARTVSPACRSSTPSGLADVERLEREGPSTLRPHHMDLSAYHPLGTCRMGADPARSVIGPSHEAHDVPGLFVVDGSAVSGPSASTRRSPSWRSASARPSTSRRASSRAPRRGAPRPRARCSPSRRP